MDELGLGRADLVGHSFGGLVALYLSRMAPERVGKLALLDPSVGLDPHELHEQARRSMAAGAFISREHARAERSKGWPYASMEAVDDEVTDHLTQAQDGGWRWRFEATAVVAACSEMARPTVVPPADVPTLLVVALRSGFVRAEFIEQCRLALGEGLAVAEVDCGHMLYLERPDEVGALLREFFTPVASG